MKDRFSDTSKQIFDNPDFEEIQNAIGQLEEIISRNGRGRGRHRDGGDGSSSANTNAASASTTPVKETGKHSNGKDNSAVISNDVDGGGDPRRPNGGANNATAAAININNNNIIIPPEKSNSKQNGIGKRTGSHPSIATATITTTISTSDSGARSSTAINKNDKNNKPIIIIATTTTGSVANHIKPSPSTSAGSSSGGGYRTYLLKKSTSSSAALSSPSSSTTGMTTLTTTAILHTNAADSQNNNRSSGTTSTSTSNKNASDADRQNNVRPLKIGIIKANGISKKSMMESTPAAATSSSSSSTNHHASQPKVMFSGTATVSTETTRSGSKTPEITITPGSEVLGGDLVDETELHSESRLLLSSAVLDRERVSPEDLPDSGCTGLLDEEDEDNCSLQRAGSSSTTAGEHIGGGIAAALSGAAGGLSAGGSGAVGASDRDSGGGSVSSSCGVAASSSTGGYQQRSTTGGAGADLSQHSTQVQKRRSVNGELPATPVYPHQLQKHLLQQQPPLPLLHVDGPLDGSPYAVINPLVKNKALADSGISVDQMKDLDRLLNALVQEAESIDIPYHARQDSLPFSYTAPAGPPPSTAPPGSKRSPFGGGITGGGGSGGVGRYGGPAASSSSASSFHQHHLHHHQSQYGSSAPIATPSASGSRYRGLEYSTSTPGTRLTSAGSTSQSYQQVPQYYHQHHQSALEEQIVNPEPISSYSRSVSRQPSISGGNNTSTGSRIGARSSEQQGYRVRPSLSSTSFSASSYGNGTGIGGTTRRLRSQSADGRRESERDEDADEWLARQMKRLQEKRASKNAPRSDWLAELKRALPAATAGGSGTSTGAMPSAIASAAAAGGQNVSSYEQSRATTTTSVSDYRPYSASTREELTASSSVASALGGANSSGVVGGGRRSHVSYSSEDDDDVELEMFQRGRRIQRHYSESAYDRGMTSASSTRAPSQLSNVVETPFPTCPPTPYFNQRPASPGKPPRSPKGIRRQLSSGVPVLQEIPSRMERAQTPVNPRPVYMIDSEVKFAQDLSEHWYKPFASREETVAALVNQRSGAFLIRNSNSFPGAFGLAVKVSDTAGEKGIRHFLIEPTRFGVRLRGSPLEPVFSSLSALVYAHSIDPLALPTTLSLPSFDILPKSSQSTTALLLRQGAACQLLFLGITSVECLTGDEAIHRGVSQISGKSPIPISLRLSKHGLTLTDVFRKQFFRLHFALNDISYAALVPGRSVAYGNEVKQVFGIVARAPRATENSVIVLGELEQGQPANAIVSFILRVIAWQH